MSSMSMRLLPLSLAVLSLVLSKISNVAAISDHLQDGDGDVFQRPLRPFLQKRDIGLLAPPGVGGGRGSSSAFHSDQAAVAAATHPATQRLLSKRKYDDLTTDEVTEFLLRNLEGESPDPPVFGKSDDEDGLAADASTSSPAATTTPTTTTTTADTDDGSSAGTTPAESKQPAWSHDVSDIPSDPSIRFGELANGMRYIVMPNSNPPGRVEMQLHVDAGANMEQDEELGMAHFLEHMMLQATESFPSRTLVSTFQSLGVSLGSHVNAYTSFIETVYRLSLPSTDNETLTPSFAWFRDIVGGGALLLDDEVQTERGVVLSEVELRDSVERRIFKESMRWRIPDHLLSQRFIGGTEETINGLTQSMLENFYEQYYVPRRVTVVLVGDMNATDMERMVVDTFDSVPDSGDRGKDRDIGTVPDNRGLQSKVFLEDEVTGLELTIDRVRSIGMIPDTEANRIDQTSMSVANSIVTRRIQKLLDNENSTIAWGGAFKDNIYNMVEFGYVWVQPLAGLWRESVATIEQEKRRAQLHGFLQSEIDEEVANRMTFYEQMVLSQETFDSAIFVTYLVDSIKGGFVASTAEDDLRIATMALKNLTADSVHTAFRTYWNTTDINIYLTANTIDVSVEAAAVELKELFKESELVEVTAPVDEDAAVWAYTDFGAPGTVVSDTRVVDLNIRQLILSNNIRVNLKRTGFEADSISIVARFGIGNLGQPKDRTQLQDFADYMMAWGGLGQHPRSELASALAGRFAGAAFSIQDGHFDITGGSNQKDFLLALQLMAAHLTDPGFAEEAVRWWSDDIPALLNAVNKSIGGTYVYSLLAWLLGDDARFAAPTEEELLAFTADDARNWLVPSFNSSYLEISLVGDFDEDQAVEHLLHTFGALPVRVAAPPEIAAEERAIAVPLPQTKSFTYESKLPQAVAYVAWEIPSYEVEQSGEFNILSSIFSDRMRIAIREDLGVAYSTRSYYSMSQAFDYGFFFAHVDGLPEELSLFTDSIMSIAANLTTELIEEGEFLRALLPYQTEIETSVRSNSYWLFDVMANCQAKPKILEWSRGRTAFYETLTVDHINDLAQQFLTQDGAFRLSIAPGVG